jgi:hypothetical protein
LLKKAADGSTGRRNRLPHPNIQAVAQLGGAGIQPGIQPAGAFFQQPAKAKLALLRRTPSSKSGMDSL